MKTKNYCIGVIVFYFLLMSFQGLAQKDRGIVANLNGRFVINNAATLNAEGTKYTFTGTFEDYLNIFVASDISIGDMISDPEGVIYRITGITQNQSGINGVIVTVDYVSGSLFDTSIVPPFPSLTQTGSLFRPSGKSYSIVYPDPNSSDKMKIAVTNAAILAIDNDMRTYTSGATGSEPTTSKIGDMFYDTTLSKFKVSTGSQWVQLDGSSSSGTITVQSGKGAGSTGLDAGVNGAVCFNADDNTFYKSNGSTWAAVTPIANGAITSDMLAANAVTKGKIAEGAVTTREIEDLTIKTEDIGPGQVTATEIADGTITLAKLATTNADKVYTTDATGKPTLVDKSTLGDTTFDGKRTITRSGIAGITGQKFDTSDLAGFLNKVFFPAQGPYFKKFWLTGHGTTSSEFTTQLPDASNVVITTPSTGGVVAIAYDIWNPGGNLEFNYTLTKRDDTAISKVELFNGASPTAIYSSTGDVTSDATVTFQLPKATFTSGVQATLNLKVTDAAGSETTSPIKVTLQNPIGVSIPDARISTSANGIAYVPSESYAGGGVSGNPYLIERADVTGSTPLNLCWGAYTMHDDTQVTDVDFTTNLPGVVDLVNPSVTNVSVSLPNSNASIEYYSKVRVRGNVTTPAYSTERTSGYYKLCDRAYLGYVSDYQNAPSAATVKGLTYKYLSTAPYFATSGIVDFACPNTPVSWYIIWAIPKSGAFTIPTAWINNLGTWTNPANKTFDIDIDGKPYWICIYNVSVSNGNKSTVKLSN